MLEGLVTNLLNRVLGMYVRNFDPKQLSIGIWNGEVKLRNLELRKEALDQLHLPLNVVEGHLGELTLLIPLSNLRGKPVKVNIEDVFLLAAPREDADYDQQEEENRAQAVKMEKLDSAELLKERNSEGMSKEEQQKQQSFVTSLTTAIIDNLQVSVKNIHIRYEDSISDPGHPFAAGLTLKDFSAISTDENWKPTFIQSSSGSAHKLAKLGALAAYWDTDASLLGTGKGTVVPDSEQKLDREQLVARFKELIVQDDGETVAKHQFILRPVSGQAGIEMDKSGKPDRAKVKARFFFDELGFVLDEDQYRDALMLVDLFHYFIRHQEYKKFQPKVRPKEDPRAWLNFAATAVLDRIHDRNRRWSWDFFRERRDDRRRYITLFKKKKKDEKMSANETQELDALERKLSYEDLRFWRSLARNQLRKENVGVQKPAQKQSWSSWIWGTKPEEQAPEETQMTDEQKSELYSAIDWDEKKALADSVDLPKDTVKMQVQMSLKTGSFALKRNPHGNSVEILKLLFDSFNTSLLQRPDSFSAKLSLQGMRLYDGTTEGNLFPQMLTVKDAQDAPKSDNDAEPLSGDQVSKELLQLNEDDFEKRFQNVFFSLAFEHNPLDGSADSALSLSLRGMEFVYNPRFVVEVFKFFQPPERHMESIGALMESANATVEGIRKQTRAGLEFALEEHKTINAQFDIRAPLIIVPDSVTEESTLCLILDAGHASVNSELVDQATIKDIQSKQRQQYTEEDYERLEGLMYDKFILKLESTQVLIGPSVEATRAQLNANDDARNLHIIDRINMDFTVEICIVPKGSELTKFRISGSLPILHASISDEKYKNLMRLLEVSIPKFPDDKQQKKQATRGSLELPRPSTASGPAKEFHTRSRSKSFQFAAQEHALVVEDDDDDISEMKFHDAPSGQDNSTASLRQRNFEFKFVVGKLRGSLYRSDPEHKQPDSLLAELIAEHFSLDFYQRPFDMTAEVSLKTLMLEDHVEQNPSAEFRHIVSSDDASTTSANSPENLFQLKFVRVNKDSPEFMTVYEGIAMNLDVHVSTINLIVTRRTLLTLLDFVLATFTNTSSAHDVPPSPESASPVSSDEMNTDQKSDDKIRIKAELKKIAVILNNDGIRLATLSLNTASVGLTLMGKSMRLGAKLGDMSLIDDVNQGASEESPLRQLVTIQGEELADFSYEIFDADSEAYPGHDSSIYLRSGSVKVNFVTEPFRKIMDFAVKFGKMQAIFNAARQAAANQATQMQEKANKIHFDILIRTPIIVFPRMAIGDNPKRDLLTAYLGEIYANNKFVPLDDTSDSESANELSVGIQNMRLTSLLHYTSGESEELELLNKVDLGFDITYVEHKPGFKRPDLEVRGSLSGTNLKISAQQLQFALELSRSIPEAFSIESDPAIQQDVEEALPESTTNNAKQIAPSSPEDHPQDGPAHLGPELGTDPDKWTKVDLIFTVSAIGLELLQSSPEEPVGDTSEAGLSHFSINDTNVKLRMLSDGAVESELLIQSFNIKDTRRNESNRFRNTMSLINTDITQQFMANVTISGGEEKSLLAILTIDSPRVILALDYLFSLQTFMSAAFVTEPSVDLEDNADEDGTEGSEVDSLSRIPTAVTTNGEATAITSPPQTAKAPGMHTAFRVNMVDAQVILLANPAISSSEAIVLGTKQVILAQQHATTLQVEKVGMFLCRMDRFDSSRLRILDDFSIATSLDVRAHGESSSMTNVHVDIEPLVLRLSLRDVLLVMQIVSKASELSSKDQKEAEKSEPERLTELKAASNKPKSRHSRRRSSAAAARTTAKSSHARHSSMVNQQPQNSSSAILKREEMSVQIGGIRVVLIGDEHELPFLDWSVKEFEFAVRDWSGAMTADANIDTFFNVYNFSKSSWEPLIEPWSLGFHMSREGNPQKLSVDLYSRKGLELTVTTATIAIASKAFDFLSTDEDVLSKPRGTDAPYKIRNFTGYTVNIWAQDEKGQDAGAAKLESGEECPWRFEDPTTTRETLSPEGATGIVGIKLNDSGFESIDRVSVNREGEFLYTLNPRMNKIQHRLLVEVSLGTDNVKYITFRSPLVVENNTQIPIELGVYSEEQGGVHRVESIAPGQSRPSPVGSTAYLDSILIRPGQGFGYTWSDEKLYWKDLLKKPTQTISCRGEQNDSSPPFYFQMNSVFDKNNPLTSAYPYMRIRISAPVELQNLLPYDFKYKIYDKHTKKDWTNFLRKGGVSPVHVVNLTHLLLLSVDLQDTPFKQSEYAIINSPSREFAREKSVVVKDTKDLPLRLKLHYFTLPDSGGAFKVTVFSPYVILNRTGLELEIKSKAFMASAKAAAGQGVITNDASRATPFMFSFSNDDQKNRALLKLGDSNWSKPQSFNAIGSSYEVILPSASGRTEMHVGVTVAQGEGKYNLTNVVTIAPRFVIKNKIGEEVNIREPGSSEVMTLGSGALQPLRYSRPNSIQQLSLCFPGLNNQWSSPFYISNIGRVHVKLAKDKQRQQLVKIEILMEEGTIFVHLSITQHWPYKVQNESDTEFLFYQANPNVDEDEEDKGSGWRPIRYRVPPRSVMPYAWDYPASKNKDLILAAHGKERTVKLQEIGQQQPIVLPPSPGQSRQRAIDIEMVADGPRQVLVLANFKQSQSMYKQKSGTTSKSTVGFEIKEQDTDVTFKAQIRLTGVGISLINQNLRELLYVTFRDIELKYNESALYQTVNWTTKWIQIDNQLYGGIFPILLYPSVVPKTGKEMEAHPIFHMALTRVKDDSYGVTYIKYFTVLLQQMTFEIDEDFIFALLDFSKVPGASWLEVKEGKLCDEELDLPEPRQDESGQDVYFELLHLQPMQIDLSFVRTERINAEDTMSNNNNPFMFAVNVLTMSLGNVNDAPLRYNALLLENARISFGALIANIQEHYVQQSLQQVHVVLGSADFLGNPVGLFNNVSSGVADIFYEPYQGLVMTDRPQDLGLGIAKGASSFVKKSVFGFSDSMAKVTGSISKGLAAASMDKEFQDQRRMSKARNRPKHALYGITSGGNAFASSLASGIGGLARHPMEGAEKEGVAGFMKGMGKGVLGLATKPAIGAFDLASNLAEGVRNTTTVFDAEGLDRVRLTRFIGQDGIVRPYSQREALGQFWLKTVDNGKYFNENYIAHLELPGKDMMVMLTYNSILLVRTKKLATEWDVPLQDIMRISKERTGMNITLKEGRNGPFIPIQDEGSRNWLYRQIAVAVNAYNEKWQAKTV